MKVKNDYMPQTMFKKKNGKHLDIRKVTWTVVTIDIGEWLNHHTEKVTLGHEPLVPLFYLEKHVIICCVVYVAPHWLYVNWKLTVRWAHVNYSYLKSIIRILNIQKNLIWRGDHIVQKRKEKGRSYCYKHTNIPSNIMYVIMKLMNNN